MASLEYRVKRGDTLSEIALAHRVTVDALARLNGISNVNLLYAGQTLKIPQGGLLPALPPTLTGTEVGRFGRISSAEGVDLRVRPDPRGTLLKRLPFNTRLFVARALPGDWYFVTLDDGSHGYVYSKHVALSSLDPDAALHWIKPGETALGIVKQYYKGDAIRWGQDERYYINVLVEANRGEGLRGIYRPVGSGDWSQTRTRQGYLIWVPSLAFARGLREKVSSGSISHEVLQAAGTVASIFGEYCLGSAAFYAGVVHGALESVWDLLTGLVDLVEMVWKILASLLSGQLFSDLRALWDVVSSLKLRELIEAGLQAFLKRWNDPDIFRRWLFRGWLVGYAIAEILMTVFSGGVSLVKWVGKAGKLSKLLAKLPGVARLAQKTKQMSAALPEPFRKRLKELLLRYTGSLAKWGPEKYGRLSRRIRQAYSAAEVDDIAAHGRRLGLDDKQITDFLEMGAISKPSKRPPKDPLTAQELKKHMDGWAEVRGRGYPYRFNDLRQFKRLVPELGHLRQKYQLPRGKLVVQGSSLRTPAAKDIDIALLISDQDFTAFVGKCRSGILERNEGNEAITKKLLKQLDEASDKGLVPNFLFDRLESRSTIGQDLYDIQRTLGLDVQKIQFSVMKSSSPMNLYPYLEM